jgi:hypothetical protein
VNSLPPSSSYKPSSAGTLVDFDWKFTVASVVVNSSDALPSVSIKFGTAGTPTIYTPANCSSLPAAAACSLFTYNSTSKQWDLDWKPKNAAVGDYYVTVSSGKTGQTFGPFLVKFKN